MAKFSFKPMVAVSSLALILLSPLAVSHFDDKEFPQSYRQSYFALLAANFGPMVSMVKGEMAWDQESFKHYANDLAVITSLDLMRGFPEGSHTGKTRAKPTLWDNMEDFTAKSDDLRTAALALQKAADSGDKAAIMEAFKATGGSCKSCHDEYKSKDYLN